MARPIGVAASVQRDLEALDEQARKSGLAASALTLARRLDGDDLLTARDQATLAAELRQTLAELRRQFPQAKRQEDPIDQLRARREARRGASG